MQHGSAEMNRSRCSACGREECPAKDYQDDSSLYGWRLGLASIGLFLSPILLAIVGAMCFGRSSAAQFVGALAGLSVGLAVPIAAVRLRRRGDGESA